MNRFAVCLLAAFSFLISSAIAAPRPGAPRPLLIGSTLIIGTNVRFEGEALTFAREENGVLDWLVATPRRDENADSKIIDWLVSTPDVQPSPDVQNALSPDRLRLAYVSKRSGMEAIYLEPVDARMDNGNIRRIATMARNPVWLNNNTLLYESTRPGRKGLYRIALSTDGSTPGAPQQLFARGGEFALSRDGKLICVAEMIEKNSASQLYLLSIDGSGARALAQTEGARRPCFSADGKAIYYDAPAPLQEGARSTPQERDRVLWMLPLVASPPVAQLFAVREGKNGEVEILGTLFSHEDGVLQARLDFSPGEAEDVDLEAIDISGKPKSARVWFACPLNRAPIQSGVLGSSPLPRKRDGELQTWTLRLVATDGAGERTQSTLTFNWPLEGNAFGENDLVAPPAFALPPDDSALESEVQPKTPTPAPAIVPVPVVRAPVISKPVVPAPVIARVPAPIQKPRVIQSPSSLPVPALPPAPSKTEFDPDEISPVPFPVRSTPAPPPLARREEVKPAPRVVPKPTPQKTVAKPPAPKPAPKSNGGIPSRMKSGATVPVTVILKNTGSRSWSSTGDSPVRLIYRWVNANSNIRQRWAVHWLREVVQPGKSTQMKFDLAAPPATGRFILTYALVRLNPQIYDGKNYKPPSTKSKDHRWPGEFGAVSFEITVTS